MISARAPNLQTSLLSQIPKSASEVRRYGATRVEDGTYELVGPKIQGGAEGIGFFCLILHGESQVIDMPRTFADIRDVLQDMPIEGVVFHHDDGRMAKVKRKDFGFPWPLSMCDLREPSC